jgi:hypothetical protein
MITIAILAALLVGVATLVAATARAIRQDRPASPPADPDWREESLSWSRLGIR